MSMSYQVPVRMTRWMPCLESTMKANLKSVYRGFTLIEMAMVLFIVALLLGGLLPTLSGQVEQRRVSETRKQLDEIQQAVIGFAIINGRLPCPADRTIATIPGVANGAGQEATTGVGIAMTCTNTTGNAAWGVLPWATLGVSETDAWGRRFTYRVTAAFADGADGTGSASCAITTGISFQLCSSGNLNVLSSSGGSNVASNVPAAIVSHGANGLGAYTPSGSPISGATGDELENADNNNTFVSRDFIQNGFDDIVIWISPNTLMNRMVTAVKLP